MDGNKKITGIVCACIIALALTACKVQPRGYVGLYINNLTSVNDTIDTGEAPLNLVDTALAHVINPTSVIEAELPDFLPPAEEVFRISSDQYEIEKLLKGISDSVQLLSYQIIELQNQLEVMPDTSFSGENPQVFQPPDSLQTEIDFKQLKQDKNDAIVVLRKQLNELQNFAINKSDTLRMVSDTVKSPNVESQQTDYLSQQQLEFMDTQILRLQEQVDAVRNATARRSQQTYITRAPAQVQPLRSRQTDQLTQQLFNAQNDTIQFLRSQLRNLQPQPLKRDSAYLEEAEEMQPEKEHVATQKATAPQALHDSIQLLKTLVLSLEQQNLPGKATPALANQVERDALYNVKTDTTLIIAFYERGEIKPLGEESVLKQIKELCSNKNVTKITLSGYTDSSGSEIINKEITNRRLNYLSEMIVPSIAKEKIFFQNFGDIFASDKMVSNERRIEIRILTK